MDRSSGRRMPSVVRWIAIGTLALLFVAIVQSVRHPARLWSSGRLGRVLAWGTEPDTGHPGSA